MKSLIFILLLFVFAGCDILNTREAEKPDQPRSDFQQAVSPEILIQNLINSLKDKNVENYLACFSDSAFTDKIFRFSPSSGAASQFPFLSDSWNKKDEEHYFNNMKIKVTEGFPITLTISNATSSQQTDSIIYAASYSLNVPHNDTGIPNNYQGELRFDMVRDARSVWTIFFWQDNKSTDLPSWSELKGRLFY